MLDSSKLDDWITGEEVHTCACGLTYMDIDGGCERCDVDEIQDEEWRDSEYSCCNMEVCCSKLWPANGQRVGQTSDVAGDVSKWELENNEAW